MGRILGSILSNLNMIHKHLNISFLPLWTDYFEIIHSAAENIWPDINRCASIDMLLTFKTPV